MAHAQTPDLFGIQPNDKSHNNAAAFAVQLSEVVGIVERNYVQPIPRKVLVGAAIRGLYDAAGREIPPTFDAELQKSVDDPILLQHVIREAREKLGNPERLRGAGAVHAALKALTKSLDPYSDVIVGEPPRVVNGFDAKVPQFGLEFAEYRGDAGLVIKTVSLGSPAQKAGLRPGDRITHIDGQAINPKEVDPQSILEDDQLELSVYRPGAKSDVQATLRKHGYDPERVLGAFRRSDNSWEYYLDEGLGIAQIRLSSIEAGSCEALIKTLEGLEKVGLRGLILDLRWCPGGYLDEARAVADVFLGEYSLGYLMFPTPANLLAQADVYLDTHCNNAVVHYRPNSRTNADHQQVHASRSFVNIPVVVLINGETMGGGELIAAVLQDNRRAFILGQRTRGKGSVQTMVDLSRDVSIPVPNTKLKLTNGFLIRPNGKNFHRFPDSKLSDDWGVRPDAGLEFRVSPDLNKKLRDWWELLSLRPGFSSESLPIDDPDADPQRGCALRLLRKSLN
jgi:carboxyl-terminal processing protease